MAKIILILKPIKDPKKHTSYRPIALLSPLVKLLESTIHSTIKPHLPQYTHQHGSKTKHLTTTALYSIIDPIINGFNQKRPPVIIAIDFAQASDTTNMPNILIKLHTWPTGVQYSQLKNPHI